MSYKTTCPACGKSNFYVTPENGKKFCFNCYHFEQEGTSSPIESVRSEYVNSIRSFYTTIADYYHSCLESRHIKYLHSRGISDATIKRLKIGYCPDSSHVQYTTGLAVESGIADTKYRPFLADRIVFPYWCGDAVTDIRGRSLTSDVKYKSPFHSAYFRGADFAFQVVEEPVKTLVVTEGEIKTIIPNQEGLPTAGLPGMNSFRKVALSSYKKIVLCFDNQRNKRRELLASIKRCADKFENPYIATLPLRNADKQDIDSYILNYGIESYKKVIGSAVPFKTWLRYAY